MVKPPVLKKNVNLLIAVLLIFSSCRGRKEGNKKKGEVPKVLGRILKEGESFVVIRGETLIVKLAITVEERMRGFMYVEEIPENYGMLFIYDKEDTLSFWMKNTPIPLSIAFLDKNGTIVDIQDMEPLTTSPYKSRKPAKYALEVKRGWFKSKGIKVGDSVELPFLK